MKKKTVGKKTSFKSIRGRTQNQREYIKSIRGNDITICTGLAGTGKTLLALYEGLKLVTNADTPQDRLIVIRPYMPSSIGEDLGALPGDLSEKVAPFAESISDNLRQFMSESDIRAMFMNGTLQFMILSMCRGRSFNNCVVLVEEAQNVPVSGEAFKMLLTRIGENCKMIISGDIDQCDIDPERSGLQEAIELLYDIPGIGITHMGESQDVQRNALVREVLNRYGTKDYSRV